MTIAYLLFGLAFALGLTALVNGAYNFVRFGQLDLHVYLPLLALAAATYVIGWVIA